MNRAKRGGLLCVVWIAVFCAGQAGATDLAISPDGHRLSYRGKPCILVGDSGTQCVMQNSNLDYRRWLDDCARAGLNCVHIWSFMAPRQHLDGSIVEERYGYVYPGMTPWARKTDGPRATDGGFQWDLRRWDEGDTPDHYWPRLRDLCRTARDKGQVVGITVFWGWPKHPSDWAYHPFNVVNGGPLEDPGKVATRVQTLEVPGTEIWKEPWSEQWTRAKKSQWLWENFAVKLLDETQHFGNAFYAFMDEHSYPEGNGGDHFLDFFKKRAALWADWNKRQATADMIYEQPHFSDDRGRNPGVLKAYDAKPARPFVLLEGGPYRGEAVRLNAWSVLMGGGHFIFHNDAEQETARTGVMGYDPKVPGGDTGAERRQWLGHAARFFNEYLRHPEAMVPDNALAGAKDFCLASPGSEYVVYSPAGSDLEVTLDLSQAPGRFRARFFNCRSGQWQDAGASAGGSVQHYTKPDVKDWALLVSSE